MASLAVWSLVRTTVQEHSVDDHYIVDKALLDPVDVTSQEVIETVNDLVNDGSSLGAHKIDMIVPPKLTSEITKLSTLEPKRFLRDLSSGKVKQICVLVAEDEYVIDIRSAIVFTETERVLSKLIDRRKRHR